jgi:hypothetical protein
MARHSFRLSRSENALSRLRSGPDVKLETISCIAMRTGELICLGIKKRQLPGLFQVEPSPKLTLSTLKLRN